MIALFVRCLAIAAILLVCCLRAQYQELPASMTPPKDALHYYEDRGVLLATDGVGTWEHDGSTWTLVRAHDPAWIHNMVTGWRISVCYDRARDRVVMLATDQSQFMYWICEWDGQNWSFPFYGFWPGGAAQIGTMLLCYHEGLGSVIYYRDGGLSLWDGLSFQAIPLQGLGAPPSYVPNNGLAKYTGMEYDAKSGKVVIMGRSVRGAYENVVYEWDGLTGWSQLPNSGSVRWPTVYFDWHRGSIVMGDPASNGTLFLRDSFGSFVPHQLNAPAIIQGGYDRRHNRMFMWDTFISDVFPATYEPHGDGCALSSTLDLAEPWTRAWLGRTLSTKVSTPSPFIMLLMGFSDRQWGANSLPLSLASYGMSGCNLRVAPDATLLGFNPGIEVRFDLTLPNATSLLGLEFFQQALASEPGVTASGLVLTGARRGTVGQY